MKKKINLVALILSIIFIFLAIKTMDIAPILLTGLCFLVGIATVD